MILNSEPHLTTHLNSAPANQLAPEQYLSGDIKKWTSLDYTFINSDEANQFAPEHYCMGDKSALTWPHIYIVTKPTS